MTFAWPCGIWRKDAHQVGAGLHLVDHLLVEQAPCALAQRLTDCQIAEHRCLRLTVCLSAVCILNSVQLLSETLHGYVTHLVQRAVDRHHITGAAQAGPQAQLAGASVQSVPPSQQQRCQSFLLAMKAFSGSWCIDTALRLPGASPDELVQVDAAGIQLLLRLIVQLGVVVVQQLVAVEALRNGSQVLAAGGTSTLRGPELSWWPDR